MHRIILLACFFFTCFPDIAKACGFDWVGECASSVHLRINGTTDSFIIADCPSGIRFDGLNLGVLRTLSLANAHAITWESCQNNVSAVALRFRVYEQGGAGGNFQTLYLDQDFFTLSGPYTTRYRSKAVDQDLTTGLSAGHSYLLELYFVAEIDTIGDDFIPETQMLKNNNGLNYIVGFTYGGSTAAPFVAVPTQIQEPRCHGENNGLIRISVWGDQSGLTYDWSNMPLNFYQQNNLPAGTYTVTVTGTSYSETITIALGQPDSLVVAAEDILPVGCGGGTGAAAVYPLGGTLPYQYLWDNGETGASATFSSAGNHTVTIVDARQCLLVHPVIVPNAGLVERSVSAHICEGESVEFGGQSFSEPGAYTLLIPGNNACDTLLFLTLTETNTLALLSDLPDHILIACNAPAINLCATDEPAATFQWSKDGIPATPTPCLLATAGGIYAIEALWNGCTASRQIISEEHLVPVPASIHAQITLTCNGFQPNPVLLRAQTEAFSPAYQWLYEGELLSTADSCWFSITEFETIPPGIIVPVLPQLSVTDGYGCTAVATTNILVTSADVPFAFADAGNASGPAQADGSAAMIVSGGQPPYSILWDNGATTFMIEGLLPGLYCATVQDANGCTAGDCAMVSFSSDITEANQGNPALFPQPVMAGARLEFRLPSDWPSGQITVALWNASGQKEGIAQFVPEQVPPGIDIPADLSPGWYLLDITGPGRRIFAKLLVNK